MKKKKKLIVTAIVSIVLVISIISGISFINSIPAPKTETELLKIEKICKKFEISNKLYVIDCGTFKSIEERHLAVSLQGIVSKTKPQIYIITNDADREYLKAIEESGTKLIYQDKNGENWTIKTLLPLFIDYIGDKGYSLYKESENGEGLNIATNLATLNGWLPVHKNLEKLVTDAGLTLKEDLTDEEYSSKLQENFFDENKEHFNYNAVISLKYECTGLRDLAIQQGFYIFYIDDDENTTNLRCKILDYAGKNTAVLGWGKYEVAYVNEASERGCYVLPSDHSHNNSVLASVVADAPKQSNKTVKTYTDTTKHYCALVFSDGDNIQWIQNGYAEYYKKLSLKKQFPITWSFSPTLYEFSPITADNVYNAATEKDYFIAGVSGAGYIHPSQYPADALESFTDKTAANMLVNNMEYVSILDSTPENFIKEKALCNSLEFYGRYDNIKGGVLSLDPERYQGGKGKVYFVNDKPFVSNRLSLWHPDGEGAEVTKEWLKEQAEIVNNYSADINTINGYTVINVHPWTIDIDDLSYFVSQLDENVQLVTVDELLTMIENNVPHEDKSPK